MCYSYSVTFGQDPCTNYAILTKEEKRSPNYTLDFVNDIALSDDRLETNWYKIDLLAGSEMPNTSPGPFQCGTQNPIWLNGTFFL